MIDTHCHLYLEEFDNDRAAMKQRAFDQGVERFYLPNIDSGSLAALQKMVTEDPDHCFPMMGLHPCSVKANSLEAELELVKRELGTGRYSAVGEIGIDLYWDKSTLPLQQEAFTKQAQWAKDMGLPIVIHARDAFQEIFDILDELNDERLFGIFHCFTGGLAEANKVMAYGGFKMGIGGVVTFKNGGLSETLESIPLEMLVLETDAPYIAPAPFRGKRNEPAYLVYIVQRLADIYGLTEDKVKQRTTGNALEVFGR